MDELKRYRVTGVSKTAGTDVQVEFDALNEANARVKAELREVVVTSVEQIRVPPTPSPIPASLLLEPTAPALQSAIQDNAPALRAVTVTPAPPPSQASLGESSQ
ncbi:MAG: hypothetical protein ACOYN0_20245, partial [Phycisphaerales bacterium]